MSSQEDVKFQQLISIPAYVPGVLCGSDPTSKKYISQFEPLSYKETKSKEAKEARYGLSERLRIGNVFRPKTFHVGLCYL